MVINEMAKEMMSRALGAEWLKMSPKVMSITNDRVSLIVREVNDKCDHVEITQYGNGHEPTRSTIVLDRQPQFTLSGDEAEIIMTDPERQVTVFSSGQVKSHKLEPFKEFSL